MRNLDVFGRASFWLVNAQWYNCHNLDDEAVKWISPEWRTVDIRCKMVTVYNIFAFIGRKLRSDLSVTVPQCFFAHVCLSRSLGENAFCVAVVLVCLSPFPLLFVGQSNAQKSLSCSARGTHGPNPLLSKAQQTVFLTLDFLAFYLKIYIYTNVII